MNKTNTFTANEDGCSSTKDGLQQLHLVDKTFHHSNTTNISKTITKALRNQNTHFQWNCLFLQLETISLFRMVVQPTHTKKSLAMNVLEMSLWHNTLPLSILYTLVSTRLALTETEFFLLSWYKIMLQWTMDHHIINFSDSSYNKLHNILHTEVYNLKGLQQGFH